MEAIINFFSNILSALFSSLFKTREPTEFDKQYEKLRFEIVKALTMYSCNYYNPVDLAQMPEGKLPQEYVVASDELRKLGATANALGATMPAKKKKLPITKDALSEVSSYLIGLSNSMTTPYNCGVSSQMLQAVQEWESEIKRLLSIE